MRRLGITLVFIGVVSMAVQSAKYAVSDYYLERAKAHYRVDSKAPQAERIATTKAALTIVNRALRFRPHNAAALDFKSTMLHRMWWFKAEGYRNDEVLAQAISLNQQALQVRPHWPYSYLSIVSISAQSADLNQMFYGAFDNAYDYGRYDSVVALKLLYIAASRWSKLDFVYKIKAIELARLSLYQKSNSPKLVGQQLERYGVLAEFCGRLPDTTAVQQMCRV